MLSANLRLTVTTHLPNLRLTVTTHLPKRPYLSIPHTPVCVPITKACRLLETCHTIQHVPRPHTSTHMHTGSWPAPLMPVA